MAERFDRKQSDALLSSIAKSEPGFGSLFNTQDTIVSIADEERRKKNQQFGGGILEFFPPGETGPPGADFGNPNIGFNTLEIFDEETANDPDLLRSAVRLDLLHLLPFDEEFKPFINEFKSTFSGEQIDRFSVEAAQQGRSLESYLDSVVVPRYLRGGLNELPDKKLGAFSGFAKSFRGQKRFPRREELFSSEQKGIISKISKKLKTRRMPKFNTIADANNTLNKILNQI